jgi:hypothetical protein
MSTPSLLNAIGGIVASDVTSLLAGGAIPQLVETLVANLLSPSGVSGAESNLLAWLQHELDATEGHASAHGMYRASMKQVENAMSPDRSGARPGGVTAQQQAAVGVGLAQNAALALAAAGQCLLDLAQAQAALEAARGSAGEAAARAVRERAEAVYAIAWQNVTKAYSGAALQPVTRVVMSAAPSSVSQPAAA